MSDILTRLEGIREVVEDDTEAAELLDDWIGEIEDGTAQPMSGGGGNNPPIKK